jgi:hypothetical protein
VRIDEGLSAREIMTAVEAAFNNHRAISVDRNESVPSSAATRSQHTESFSIARAMSSRYSEPTKYNGHIKDYSALSFNISELRT